MSLTPESRVNCIFLLCAFLVLESDFVNQLLGHQENKQYISKYGKTKPRKLPDYDNPLTVFSGIYPPIEEYEDSLSRVLNISIDQSVRLCQKKSG